MENLKYVMLAPNLVRLNLQWSQGVLVKDEKKILFGCGKNGELCYIVEVSLAQFVVMWKRENIYMDLVNKIFKETFSERIFKLRMISHI